MDPLLFSASGDPQEWRREVARWVDFITTAADKGQAKAYPTVKATLARHLYERGLPRAQKSVVDEAQAQRKLDYRQDDQVKAVSEIVELLAVDPPIAVVTRLISSFKDVTSCKRKKNEELVSFVSRFQGLAAEHLMHAGPSNSSQIGEVLAITLLNNADLAEQALTNAKLQLISHAEARDGEAESSVQVRNTDLQGVFSCIEQISDVADVLSVGE